MAVTVEAVGLEYVDPRINANKFYNVYYLTNGEVVTQYGRIGTHGTWSRKNGSRVDALRQISAKVSKGYNRTGNAVHVFPNPPSEHDLSLLPRTFAHQHQATSPKPPKVNRPRPAAATLKAGPAVGEAIDLALEKAYGSIPSMKAPVTDPTRPMLAKEVGPSELDSLLGSVSWDAQLKLDGDRVVIEINDNLNDIAVLNRSGQPKTKNVSPDMLAPFYAFRSLRGRWVFDGEVVGSRLYIFDMLAAGDYHDENDRWDVRWSNLQIVAPLLFEGQDVVKLVETAHSPEDKRAMYDKAVQDSKEGVIFRVRYGTYQPGKRSTFLVKYKFLNEADCVVTALSPGGKDSVVLSVYDNGTLREVGQASTIGKTPTPQVGDVWEVRFLYVVSADNPRMVQPRLMRKRTDKKATECSIEQFATAVTNKEPE